MSILAGDLAARGVPIRTLYQTCCHGSGMIDGWERARISAVNGARGVNWVAMLAPVFFLQRWTGGAPYGDAVAQAMQDEIAMLGAHEQQLGIRIQLLTPEKIAESEQLVGGQTPNLLWSDSSALLPSGPTAAVVGDPR